MSWELITTSFWRFIGFKIVLIGATVSLTVVAAVSQAIPLLGANDFNVLTEIVSVIAFILLLLVNVFVAAFTYLAEAMAYRRLSGEGDVVHSD